MNGLDLFSGIGGISVALKPWVRPVAYCEIDRYCQGVLLSRMRSGELSEAPIWDDVRTLEKELLPKIDIIYGGFPCQDISVAGLGKGLGGKRSGLFFEIVRLAEEVRPAFIFFENVPAIRTRGAARIYFELAHLGYDLRWTTLSASAVGAPHLRNRWFLLAAHPDRIDLRNLRRWSSGALRKSASLLGYDGTKEPLADADGERELQQSESLREGRRWARNSCEEAADAESERRIKRDPHSGGGCERTAPSNKWARSPDDGGWWSVEPDVGRVAHGITFRVDRIRSLGNGVVPKQVREAFTHLIGGVE